MALERKGSLTQEELLKLYKTPKVPDLPYGVDAVATAQPVSPTTNRNNEAELVYQSKLTGGTDTKKDTTTGTKKTTGTAGTATTNAYEDYLSRLESQRKANLDATIKANNAQADASAQEAYIAHMKSLKNLPQLLRSAGVSGGGSETTITDMNNTYENNRNSIIAERDKNNARRRLAYQNGVDGDYAQYLSKGTTLGTTAGAKASAKSNASTTATNTSAIKNTASKNENTLASIIQYYRSLGYTDEQITARMAELGIVG